MQERKAWYIWKFKTLENLSICVSEMDINWKSRYFSMGVCTCLAACHTHLLFSGGMASLVPESYQETLSGEFSGCGLEGPVV